MVGLSLICLDINFLSCQKFPLLLLVYKIPGSLNWNRSLTNLTNWNRMKFLPIHTKRCVHSKFFLHLIMIRCGKVSSKSNIIESYSWDYDPEALLFNTLWEKYLGHKVAPPSFPSFLPSTCLTSSHNKCKPSLDFASTNFFFFNSPLGRIG